jgi:hypothetical protein
MIRQCAWCLKILGEVPPLKDMSVTHTICEECAKEQMKEIAKMEKAS